MVTGNHTELCWLGLENTPTASLQRGKIPNHYGKYPRYDSKLSDSEALEFGECGVLLHCHCSQVHSALGW